MSRLLRCVIACGAIPLAVGTLIYALWLATRWDGLTVAGFFWIPIGFAVILVGLIALLWHFTEQMARRELTWARFGNVVLTAALLLINFPTAAFFVFSARDISSKYTLKVVNNSDRVIESFVASAPGVNIEFGSMSPGHSMQRSMHFSTEGELTFTARDHDGELTGVIEGYVTNGLGNRLTIMHLRNDLNYTVEWRGGLNGHTTTRVESLTAKRIE